MTKKTDHKKELEALHGKAMAKFEEYVTSKKKFKKDDHKKIKEQKEKWQASWNELMETLVVLEHLEI
jgi:hypothetical protein